MIKKGVAHVYKVVRSEDYEGEHYDLYLTADNEYGTESEALEFESKHDADIMKKFQEDNSPYNNTGDYTFSVESD